jgi:hypothetical protein
LAGLETSADMMIVDYGSAFAAIVGVIVVIVVAAFMWEVARKA